ncbi:SPOR domain-containing protein [Parasphingorhabdus sp. DH2-15]|uniref:SPOR domain-containing protein n=1 Tax=Parasphingorhabdus sp. DH2-15 TaxID=3444112 RepID=UPI003F6849BF
MSDENTFEDAEDQLIADDEERLPWLESADDYDSGSSSAMKVLGLLLLGVVFLGLVVAMVYFLQNRNAQTASSGGGQLIEAPEGDYKVAPKDAGGKEFQGTGDASPAAAEGEERVTALAGADKVTTSGGVLVQLGAYSNEAKANSGWNTLSGRYDYIAKLPKKIAAAKVEAGTVYRLSAVAPDLATANSVCGRLKTAGQSCIVVR